MKKFLLSISVLVIYASSCFAGQNIYDLGELQTQWINIYGTYYNYLDLSNKELSDLTDLETVTVTHTDYMQEINQSTIKNIPSLYIDLRGNGLVSVPATLFDYCTILDLSDNNIETLPDITENSSLTILKLNNNKLSSLPQCLTQLGSLKSLYIAQRERITFNPDATKAFLSKMDGLIYCDEIKTQLSLKHRTLFSYCENKRGLHDLIYSDINIIPDIGNQTTLILDNENLESIEGLADLDIRYNNSIVKIHAIPSLKLSISNNKLTTLPDELFTLTHITALYLFNNNLSELNSKLGLLTALESLFISYGDTLPDVSHLNNLTIIEHSCRKQ